MYAGYTAASRPPTHAYIDSITTDEANGLFTVKSVLSLVLSRQELGAFIECRVETPALENIVSNQLHIDLQGKFSAFVLLI